jgi:hypothetical protein
VPPLFLTLDEVLEIHASQLALFGGSSGVRDAGLVESAIGKRVRMKTMVKKPVETIRDAAVAPVAEPRAAETEPRQGGNRQVEEILDELDVQYGEVFRRLAE